MELSTLSAKELVRHFNAIVTASHPTVPCLTEWKASKAALIAKIEALPEVPVIATRDEILAESNAAFAAQAAAEAEALKDKPTRPAKVVKEKAPAKEKTKDAAPRKGQSDAEVAAYFAKHDLNPKVMRAKLRRAGFSAPYSLDEVKSVNEKE